MQKKLNLLILGCTLLFNLITMACADDSTEVNPAKHIARVIAPRAIVYSDESMNSPLGYISSDKLITVGNPRKKKPELVPLVLYGRLAFIETKNIRYEDDDTELLNSKRGAPREHNIDILLAKPEEKLLENNSAYFNIHRFGAGDELKRMAQSIDNVSKDNFIGYGISIIHRQSAPAHFFWGAGYEYNTFRTEHLKFDLYMVNPIIGYTPVRNSLFLADLLFSMDISASAQLDISNNYENEPYGFLWGPQFGARLVFFPDRKYHVVGTFTYRKYNIIGIREVRDVNNASIGGLTRINGANLSIGFAMEI